MASVQLTSSPLRISLFSRLSRTASIVASQSAKIYSKQLSLPLLPALSFSIPSAIHLKLPSLLGDLWDGLLNAVPKKKTSYSKKRSRFLAGKGLKDVTSLNKCSACGNLKRAHLLCPYCVAGEGYRFNSEFHALINHQMQKSRKCLRRT